LEITFHLLEAAAGFLAAFFVPGLPWSFALLGRAKLSAVERAGVSAALSVAAVPTGLFLLNVLAGVPIRFETVLALALGIAAAGALLAFVRDGTALRRPHATEGGSGDARSSGMTGHARWKAGVQLLLLALVMGFAFYTSLIPRLDYAYPIHQDEWTHLAEARSIVATGDVPLNDAVSGAARDAPYPEAGYHVFLAELKLLTGLDWESLFRYLPSVVYSLTALAAYMFGRRRGFGLEAALFASMIPTTVRFLGPAFAVPMALGLLFVPITAFLVTHLWGARGLPAVLVTFLLFLYIEHPPTALLLSLMLGIYGGFQLLRPALRRRAVRRRALAQIATVAVAVALSALPFIAYNHGFVAIAAEVEPPPRELLMVPGGMMPRLGYLPPLLFFVGLWVLARSRLRSDKALIVAIAPVALFVAFYYATRMGPEVIYSRGVVWLSLVMLLVAALGTYHLRRFIALRIGRSWGAGAPAFAAALVALAVLVPSAAFNLENRHEEVYYHLLNEERYEDFVWIRDNVCSKGELALVQPHLGRPFAAITGTRVYAPLPLAVSTVPPADVTEAKRVLQAGVPDGRWLRDRGVGIVYNERRTESPDLLEVHDDVYVLALGSGCASGEAGVVDAASEGSEAALRSRR
jgi:hypothetical protein